MNKYSRFVGLDTHKESISVAIADAEGGAPRYYGEIPNNQSAISKLVKKLSANGEKLSFSYEAGPCGYEIHRQIRALGQSCEVVAPSLIPRKPGDRIKTDRRDSEQLARLHRAGELTPVWVPDKKQESIRDLTRCREDMKILERQARQRLGAFLLRHGQLYTTGRSKWTQAYFRWMERIRFDDPVQQIVLEEYINAVKQAGERVADLEVEMRRSIADWHFGPVVEALMALRGVNLITAMTVMAELGDITRFESPGKLMSFLGLVPSEYSSGGTQRRGGITKTGNGHVRRVLVEAAWCYRFNAHKSAHLQRRAEKTSEGVQAIAWKAQKRLCGRFRYLSNRGKLKVQVCTAVARELSGFIWAIAHEVLGQAPVSYKL